MTATFDFDRLLESVLDVGGAQVVPPTVVDAALATARNAEQRTPRHLMLDGRAWPARNRTADRFLPVAPRLTRVLLLALLATALVTLAVVGAALLREDPTPKELQSTFFHHFEYVIPVGSGMRVSGHPRPQMVAWTSGRADWPHASGESIDSANQPQLGEVRGVVIGLGEPAMSHSSSGRFDLGPAPPAFLSDLRDRTGVRMDAIAETTFDGRPAATTQLPGVGGSDIHPGGSSGLFVRVSYPSRLIVTEVDGTTVFILVWARNARELDAWLPVANEFVASIHFVPD